MCCIFPRVERALEFYVIYFSARGTRSGIIVLYFRVWNARWNYCVIFSARATRSVVIVLYFPRVQRDLVFWVKLISCCNILAL